MSSLKISCKDSGGIMDMKKLPDLDFLLLILIMDHWLLRVN